MEERAVEGLIVLVPEPGNEVCELLNGSVAYCAETEASVGVLQGGKVTVKEDVSHLGHEVKGGGWGCAVAWIGWNEFCANLADEMLNEMRVVGWRERRCERLRFEDVVSGGEITPNDGVRGIAESGRNGGR
jgi:hypothetical protein